MTTPDECATRFPDDAGCADDVPLLRRIPQHHVIHDENVGALRPSSAAFWDDRDGSPMSVYRQDILDNDGDSPERVMVGHDGYGLASIEAGVVRSKAQTVYSDPLPDASAHALVCGPKSKSTRRWLARQARWVIEP